MKPTPYTAPYRPAVVVDVPETVAEAEGTVSCPVYSCRLPGRACAARHLSGVAGHPGRDACGRCPAGLARAALLDVRAPTPAEVLRELRQPGSANPMTEEYMKEAIDKVLAALGNGPRSASEIRQATSLGESVVKDALQQLKRLGKVALEGAGRSARWGLVVTTGEHIDVGIIHDDPLPPAVDVAPVVEELADEPGSVREAARRRLPLDGSDAQALEGALQITERERDGAYKALGAARREAESAKALRAEAENEAQVWRAVATETIERLQTAETVSRHEWAAVATTLGLDPQDATAGDVRDAIESLREEVSAARWAHDMTLAMSVPRDHKTALAYAGRAIEAAGAALAAVTGGNHE